MDLRFVHAADLHLDSPFRGLRHAGPAQDWMRRATFDAFTRVVDLCLKEKADFLLLAGDLFDAKDRSVRARLHLAKELGRLHEAGIPTFVVHGNHDPLMGLRPGAGLPASVKVFGTAWEEAEVRRGGQVVGKIQGVSYDQEKVTKNLSSQFRRTGPGFTVGLLHANLGGETGHANYAPCTLMDLAASGLDYWALGHVHTRAVYPLPEGGQVVYPGNPQGRHVNEDGPRGCALVEVRDGRPEARFVDLDVVRWHRVEVDVGGVEAVEELGDRVVDLLQESGAVDGPRAHAARLILQGRGPVHAELRPPGALEQLEESLAERLGALDPPWLLESLEDASSPDLDPAKLKEEGGLAGAVLELAGREGALGAVWADEELKKLEQALRRHKVASPREEGRALVDEAALEVASRLLGDGP